MGWVGGGPAHRRLSAHSVDGHRRRHHELFFLRTRGPCPLAGARTASRCGGGGGCHARWPQAASRPNLLQQGGRTPPDRRSIIEHDVAWGGGISRGGDGRRGGERSVWEGRRRLDPRPGRDGNAAQALAVASTQHHQGGAQWRWVEATLTFPLGREWIIPLFATGRQRGWGSGRQIVDK